MFKKLAHQLQLIKFASVTFSFPYDHAKAAQEHLHK